MTKTLLILRHAKSSWNEPGQNDHQRPLNKRGRRDAPRIGELLLQNGITPQLIISSTAVRARLTAEAVAEHGGYTGEIVFTPNLYLAEPRDCVQAIREAAGEEESIMIVGHNPGLEDLLSDLTGEPATMPTAALAQVLVAVEEWSELRVARIGSLQNFWRPKELD